MRKEGRKNLNRSCSCALPSWFVFDGKESLPEHLLDLLQTHKILSLGHAKSSTKLHATWSACALHGNRRPPQKNPQVRNPNFKKRWFFKKRKFFDTEHSKDKGSTLTERTINVEIARRKKESNYFTRWLQSWLPLSSPSQTGQKYVTA